MVMPGLTVMSDRPRRDVRADPAVIFFEGDDLVARTSSRSDSAPHPFGTPPVRRPAGSAPREVNAAPTRPSRRDGANTGSHHFAGPGYANGNDSTRDLRREAPMPLTFRKSFRILPGVRLNINRHSWSITTGGGSHGPKHTHSSTGRRTTSMDLPGPFGWRRTRTAKRH